MQRETGHVSKLYSLNKKYFETSVFEIPRADCI